jgi:hypothetical protein
MSTTSAHPLRPPKVRSPQKISFLRLFYALYVVAWATHSYGAHCPHIIILGLVGKWLLISILNNMSKTNVFLMYAESLI